MNFHPKVFLLDPEQNKLYKLLVCADSEEDARRYAACHFPSSNDDVLSNPYLNQKTKCTEIVVTILDDNHHLPSNTLHSLYNDKEYYLSKSVPKTL